MSTQDNSTRYRTHERLKVEIPDEMGHGLKNAKKINT